MAVGAALPPVLAAAAALPVSTAGVGGADGTTQAGGPTGPAVGDVHVPKPGDSGYTSPLQPVDFAPQPLPLPPHVSALWRAGLEDHGLSLFDFADELRDSLNLLESTLPLIVLRGLTDILKLAETLKAVISRLGRNDLVEALIFRARTIAYSPEQPIFIREVAFRILAVVELGVTTPHLLDLFRDQSAPLALRLAAAEILKGMEISPDAATVIGTVAIDMQEPEDLRLQAIQVLAQMSTPNAYVIRVLTFLALQYQNEAAEMALRKIMGRSDIDPALPELVAIQALLMTEYVNGKDDHRERAVTLAGAWGPVALPWLIESARNGEPVWAAFETMGADAVESLMRLILDLEQQSDFAGTDLARETLDRLLDDTDARFAMAQLLDHFDKNVRDEA